MAPNVLLTDTNRWPAPSRLAIGLARAGCNVSAICATGHPLLKTRAVQRAFPYSGFRPLESLIAAIELSDPQIIIPCDDRGVQHLHELHARARAEGTSGIRLATLIENSLGSPENYSIVSSRFHFLRNASEAGINVPDMMPINTADDLKSWKGKQQFPWVLKADGSFGGRGVRMADSLEQAEQFFLEINRPFTAKRVIKRLIVNRDPFWIRPWWNNCTPPVIVQAHINGRPANCAAFCWKGNVLAGFGVEVVSFQGQTGPANVVRLVDDSEMMTAAKRIASRLNLSGFFGLDFMIDEQSNRTYLIEMNPRCTPLCHLQLGPGRDMIEALRAQLSGEQYRETPPVTENSLIAYFPQAWNCNSEYLQSSYQDIPQGENELIEELLQPWPDRSFLFRAGARILQKVS